MTQGAPSGPARACAALFPREARNFIMIGEAGCGKSEIALNLAAGLALRVDAPVHLFDLDQTKPLFRVRDVCRAVEEKGVTVHFQPQFYDAPTETGGVRKALGDEGCYAVLDVGGSENGAVLIGGYAPLIGRGDSAVYYIVNPYRPWSRTAEAVGATLSAVLRASRIQRVRFLCNPNLGQETSEEAFLEGVRRAGELLASFGPVEFACAREGIAESVRDRCELPVFPLHLYLSDLYG